MGNKPSGFNWHSTGEQVARNVDLSGKNVIVTGGNTGIGYETSRVLAQRGANIIIACRDEKKGREAVDKIKEIMPEAKVQVMQLDLASFSSISSFANKFKHLQLPLHILVNNAGVMGCPHKKTEDGFEMQMGTNHIEVDFDNLNAEKSYSPFLNYAQSKTANILFAIEFNNRFQDRGIYANALHPGVIRTELTRHSSLWNAFYSVWYRLGFIKDVHQGAATSIYAATAPELEKVGGKYLDDSKVAAAKNYATDPEISKRLWETTEQMIEKARNS